MDHFEVYDIAQSIALDVGAITECEFHSGIYIDQCDDDANKMAYARITNLWKSEYSDMNRELFTSAVKSVIDDAGMDCELCERIMEE